MNGILLRRLRQPVKQIKMDAHCIGKFVFGMKITKEELNHIALLIDVDSSIPAGISMRWQGCRVQCKAM